MDRKKVMTIVGGLFCAGLVINIVFPDINKPEPPPPKAEVETVKKPEPPKQETPPKKVNTSSSKTYFSIEDYVEHNESFDYVTSMTDSISKSKADIYETDMSINATVTNISSVSSQISRKVLVDDSAVILKYRNEEAFIYLNENNRTYVQIAGSSYLKNQGYDATYRPGSFFRTYGVISLANDTLSMYRRNKSSKDALADSIKNSSKKKTTTSNSNNSNKRPSSSKTNTSTKKNTSNSIRNSSTGSRPSTGGGTSFGK